jgi:glycosyltransferase involved in cell wall biosynthesis
VSSQDKNPNLENLVGASNKAFDYMACGLALVVPKRADWIRTYVEPGYAVACDPSDGDELAAHLRWFADCRERCRIMGEAGRQRILAEWNYEAQFAPVLRILEGRPGVTSAW